MPGTVESLAGNVLPSFENVGPTEHDPNRVSGPYLDPAVDDTTPDDPARLGLDIAAETEHDSCNRSATGEHHFTNPLVNGPPAFTADEFGQQCMQYYFCVPRDELIHMCSLPWYLVELVIWKACASHGTRPKNANC